jgi:hypothetical protein
MNIKLEYLFSKNDLIGSRLISWGTKDLVQENVDVPSHVAVLINEKYVFESTMAQGVRCVSYKDWLTINKEVKRIPCQKERTFEEVKELFKPLKDKKYDYLGVVYFGWRVFLYKFFKITKPTVNKWNSKSKYFCCEVIGKLTGVDYQMISPVELMVELSK